MSHEIIQRRNPTFSSTFAFREDRIDLHFRDDISEENIRQIEGVLRGLMLELIALTPHNFGQFILVINTGNRAIAVSFAPLDEELIEDFLFAIEDALDSADIIDGDVSLVLKSTSVLRGSGNPSHTSNKTELSKMRSVVIIQNTDNLCLIRAFLVCKAKHEDSKFYQKLIRNQRPKALNDSAKQVFKDLFKVREYKGSIGDFIHLCSHFKYNGVIYEDQKLLKKTERLHPKTIYLNYIDNHYNSIIDINAYTRITGDKSLKYCERCSSKKCECTCRLCNRLYEIHKQTKDGKKDKFTTCKRCNIRFYDVECFKLHTKHSKCKEFWKCGICGQRIKHDKKEEHVKKCKKGVKLLYCGGCCAKHDLNEHCFINEHKEGETKNKYNKGFIFFDYEAFVKEIVLKKAKGEERGEQQIPNLCVAMYGDKTEYETFENNGQDCNDMFCEWLISKKHKNMTAIAHNMRSYDGMFILNYLTKRNIKYKPIYSGGTKRMGIYILDKYDIRIIDSLNFIAKRLNQLPAIFGLETYKGDYPYKFNNPENWNHIGDIPDKKYFNEEKIKEDDFKVWYAKYKSPTNPDGKIYNHKEEIIDYCKKDVKILKDAMIEFNKLFLEQTGSINPLDYLTIASTCLNTYLGLFYDTSSKEICCNHTDFKDAREGFFGGRTNAIVIYHKCKPNEKIRYVDFTSLYPYVNKYCKYPKGLPEIITKDFKDINEYFGIAQVEVLAPQDLYHPLLCVKGNGKLIFGLCRTCILESVRECVHTTEERMLRGSWTTIELQKAVELGYIIHKIHKVYHFKDTKVGLFAKYVNHFLKLKQECSGKPSWVKTEADLDLYIEQYFLKEGIQLDKLKITINKGLREIAKLCLNSLWGKFGQRDLFDETKVVDEKEYFDVFANSFDKCEACRKMNQCPKCKYCINCNVGVAKCSSNNCYKYFEIKNAHYYINETKETMELTWNCFAKEKLNKKTNVFIAAYTTAHARLKLYNELLEPLGRKVLYFDTDSCIYLEDETTPKITIGDYLGDLTDELEDKKKGWNWNNNWAVEYVGLMPKTYGYRTNNNYANVKCKGFNIKNKIVKINGNKVEDGKQLDICLFKDLADRKIQSATTESFHITNDNKNKILLSTNHFEKDIRFVYTKRMLMDNYKTLPWGYR